MSYRALFGYVVLTLVSIVFAGILGLALRIMTLDASSRPPAKTGKRYHVVKRGDVLSRVAERTGVPLQELMKLNPKVDPLALVPGKRIRLKASLAATPADADARRPKRAWARRYIVS